MTTAAAAAEESASHGRGARRDAPEAARDARDPPDDAAQTKPAGDPARGISYRSSLILWLSLLVVATGLAVSVIAFRGARAGTAQLAGALFESASDHAVTKTRDSLQRAVPIAQALGGLSELGLTMSDHDALARQLAVVLRANPGLSWVSYSDEAGAFVGAYRTPAGELRVNRSHVNEQGQSPVVEHEVLPDGSWRPFRTEADSGFDPRTRPFYRLAREARRIIWTPPYIFYDQGVPGVTCANPLYDARGQLRGVLTVDFDLDLLSQFVGQLPVSPNSRMFIMTADGTMLAYPGRQPVPRGSAVGRRGEGELQTVGTLGDPLLAAFDAQLTPADRAPGPDGGDRARQFGFRHAGTDYYARATAFTISGDLTWVVGVMAPQADFLAGARRTSALAAAASVGAMLLAVVVATLLARRVSGPVLKLVAFMDGVVAGGDLGTRLRLGGAREFRQLSDALDRMLDDLRDRLRLRTSMAVAAEVQQQLLPRAAPRVAGLDVYGFSAYCDETGGDYFDYILLDRGDAAASTVHAGTDRSNDTHAGRGLLVAIGDVAGHGIGPAIVMAGTRGILHSRAASCGHLGQLMTHLNDQLARDILPDRFVTMLLWYIDPRRGDACWANAGHDPAIVYDPRDDRFTESGRGNIPLGIEPGLTYDEYAYGPLRAGQVIVLGTDGIWEARRASGDSYGKRRLMDVIRARAAGTAEQIAQAVRDDLEAFRGAEHQRDDVTLVVIKVLPVDASD